MLKQAQQHIAQVVLTLKLDTKKETNMETLINTMPDVITYNEVVKECRLAAKSVGLTFKTDDQRFNFTSKKTRETVVSFDTLDSAYNNVCSGYITSWNGFTFDYKAPFNL